MNNRLLDCSDAHRFSDASYKDRIGKCFTWIKADPTFEGLLQVLNEPEERIYLGDIPPKVDLVAKNKTKYIQSVRLEKKPTATLTENWFDNTIPINNDLVAIIGNKGKGKSALTDTIGLLSNTKQSGDFTFLSIKNFRQPKDNKAKQFQATLTWESGGTLIKGLDEEVDPSQPELVKYIPQNFLEKICTQLGGIEETQFDQELKKVIFSHVDNPTRLGKGSLDELIGYKTSEANGKIQILKQELHRINEELVSLEERVLPKNRQNLENLLAVKRQELKAHEESKPETVPEPSNDPQKQAEMSQVTSAITLTKTKIEQYENEITIAAEDEAIQTQLISVIDRLIGRLENLDRQIETFKTESEVDLSRVGLSLSDVLKISIDMQPLDDRRKEYEIRRQQAVGQHDRQNPLSPAYKKDGALKELAELQTKLDAPNQRYQSYMTALNAWEKRKQKIIGSENEAETIKSYDQQLKDLDAVPAQINDAKQNRSEKAQELHAVILQLAQTYRELYAPVNDFIESRPLAKDKFHLNFEVGVVDVGLEDQFFDFISHAVVGSFAGVNEGLKRLKEILARQGFNTAVGIQEFLTEIIDTLENDKRPGGKPVRIQDQLKTRKTLLGLYDLIFGLEYLKPRYALRMGDKELDQLSPGERGTLLLVFYLLVDKDDVPLVIDQPEENLDNQTVYDLLVPCIKEAKKRRQIFLVTHNPNLAVVCDAEQVICADLDKLDNYTMNYISGAIENPVINKAIVDILEGTMPAFDNRESKYFDY